MLLMRFLGLVDLVRDEREFDQTEKLQHTMWFPGFTSLEEVAAFGAFQFFSS